MMSARGYAVTAWTSMGCVTVTAVLYYLLWAQTFRDSWFYEGWVFLGHLGLAVVGLLLAVIGIRKHPIVCGISAAVASYFVLIQFVL